LTPQAFELIYPLGNTEKNCISVFRIKNCFKFYRLPRTELIQFADDLFVSTRQIIAYIHITFLTDRQKPQMFQLQCSSAKMTPIVSVNDYALIGFA
jgi:hypothetical protein